jgi:hypothetical protein
MMVFKYYLSNLIIFFSVAGVSFSNTSIQQKFNGDLNFEIRTEPGSVVFINQRSEAIANRAGSARVMIIDTVNFVQLRIENRDFRTFEQTLETSEFMNSGPIIVELTPLNGAGWLSATSNYSLAASGIILLLLLTAGVKFLPFVQFPKRENRRNVLRRNGSKSSKKGWSEIKRNQRLSEHKSETAFSHREAAPERSYSIEKKFDNYTLLTKIAEGGVASIYEAKNNMNGGQKIALKIMSKYLNDTDMVNKFIGEGWALQKIRKKFPDSPVVEVYDFGRQHDKNDGLPYIAMELIEGRPLSFFIKNSVLGNEQKVNILRQLAYAIDTAHQCKVLHRDLAPDNILIKDAPDLEIRLIDFGVARHEVHWLKGTSVGAAFGKPEYMAPEQIEGGELSKAVDYYSFGAIVFALFTGRPPFQDVAMYKVFDMHINHDLPDMPGNVPPNIQKLVHWLMKKNPSERPDNIQQIMQLLT